MTSRVCYPKFEMLWCVQFLGMSIWTWKEGSVAQGVAQTVVQVVTHPAQEAASWTAVWLPILMMYSPVQVVCTALALSFMLAPPAFAAAFWVGSLAVYYAVTLPGAPEHTGQPCHPSHCLALLEGPSSPSLHCLLAQSLTSLTCLLPHSPPSLSSLTPRVAHVPGHHVHTNI